jgi:hypothetical protein
VGVGQHLGLDVAGLVQVALDEALATAERRGGLADGRLVELGDLLLLPGHLHAPAPAAERGLDRDGEPVLLGEGLHLVGPAHRLGGAGDERRARPGGDVPGGDLVPQVADGLRGGADPGEVGVDDGLGEVGVLAEEAVPGVDGVGAGALRDVEQLVDREIGVGGGGAAEGERLVGQAHEGGVPVGVGVDGDAPQSGVAAGPDDADGDLPTVRDENLAQARHGRPPRGVRWDGCPESVVTGEFKGVDPSCPARSVTVGP